MSVDRLPDGRLRITDGPIDVLALAEGPGAAAALRAAVDGARGLLDVLCAELPLLRSASREPARGAVAARMQQAVWPLPGYITPMAAVAGAVADHVLAAMLSAGAVTRAYVNNGGDIALHLAPGEALRVGLARPGHAGLHGSVLVRAEDGVRGIATSGWPGRSFSRGIADAATVLAGFASAADAAATVVANAVDLPGHPAVVRAPARSLAPDSDLGDRLVTVAVGPLSPAEIGRALGRGAACADALQRRGLMGGALIRLANQMRAVHSSVSFAALQQSPYQFCNQVGEAAWLD